MYTVSEAARRMEISERHLRLLLRSGQVKGKKLGRDWLVYATNYKRKRVQKSPTLPLGTYLGKGDTEPTTMEGDYLVKIVEGSAVTVGELKETLIYDGILRKYAMPVVRRAIREGVLAVLNPD
jgi:excisionase family DNA binding protein